MESLFQFLDEVDDFIIAMAARLQRSFSPQPPERRRVPRPPVMTPTPGPEIDGLLTARKD